MFYCLFLYKHAQYTNLKLAMPVIMIFCLCIISITVAIVFFMQQCVIMFSFLHTALIVQEVFVKGLTMLKIKYLPDIHMICMHKSVAELFPTKVKICIYIHS